MNSNAAGGASPACRRASGDSGALRVCSAKSIASQGLGASRNHCCALPAFRWTRVLQAGCLFATIWFRVTLGLFGFFLARVRPGFGCFGSFGWSLSWYARGFGRLGTHKAIDTPSGSDRVISLLGILRLRVDSGALRLGSAESAGYSGPRPPSGASIGFRRASSGLFPGYHPASGDSGGLRVGSAKSTGLFWEPSGFK